MKKQMKLLTCLTKPIVLFVLLFALGVGNMWGDTWLYGSFQSWVAKDNNYKFTYDGSVGNYYLELEANTEYEFKIIDGDNYYSYTNQNFTTTTTDYIIYTNNQNCKITTGEAGVYIFKTWWADNQRHMAVYFPQARLKKGSYLYVDARNTNWVNNDGVGFGARYFYKYYDSGVDLSSGGTLDCTTPLEYQVHYTIVPDNDYVGQVQIERKNPADMNGTRWDYANNIAAFSRSSSKQNCLSMEYATGGTWSGFTPLWTTYCPIKATSSISDNGTVKTWGGAGTSESPYYVATGSKIKVSSSSTDHISDANMTTKYDFEVRNASDVQQTHSDGETTTYEYTVPATNDVVYKVRVNSYNYYNSTSSTANWSSDIYYKARTPYTISYNAGTGGSGERASETKLKDVTFALPNSAIFTRTGYTQTGWTKSNLGSQTHALGANYTDNSDQAFYPAWTPNPYAITLNDHDATSAGTSGVNVTFDANTNLTTAITIPKKTGYGFHGYYTGESGTGTQIIDAEGNFIASAGSNAYLDGSKNWKHADNITLHAYWVASAVTTPTVTAAMPAYIGEDVTITLSATSTNVAEPVVIFFVADNSNSTTYEVVATPGAKGSMPTYSTTHTATFTAKHAATYSVTAKVYSGKLIDNFDGSLAYWKALGGGSFNASATNPAIQAGNGSNTVMQITRGDDTWKTVQTKKAANDDNTTNWNYNFGYIYISMYSTSARTPKIKYTDDDGGREVKLADNSLSANTWTRKQFPKAADDSQIDFILPFIEENTGDILYIDDIILSNESSMTAQATSSSASTTITQPTISSCTAEAATTNWGGSNINISLSAQTTYLADAVVVFFVTDGSNSTTYEVTATPGTPGANNAITHTATFVAQHAATYSVTAKLYNGKFIDNFEGSASAWSGLGYGTCERVSNVEREADNGSTKVMKITRSANDAYGETYQTAWTTTEENSGTKTSWGHEYGYIHMRYYAPQAETPEVEYWDDGSVFKNTTLSSQTASTWHELVFAVNGGVVNYIHPFVLSGGKTDGHYIYIDDIILSNRSTWAPIKNTSDVDLTADASDVTIRDAYTVTLDNREATSAGTERVDVTYGATLSAITKPTKTHYDFGGYFTEINGGGSQLIDANGNWIKNVTDYTGASGDNPTWVHADDITLYAKWTEHEYAITINVVGSGTTSPASSTTAKYVTASGDITATPSAGYSFREWGFSETGTGNYDVYVSDGSTYSSTNATIRIKAQRDGTLTANFTPNTYTVSFENLSADAGHKGSLDTTVTFNDTIHMKGRIEVPSKINYDFGGYYTSDDEGETLGTQLIDENGNWKKGISGYTGTKEDVASWVYAGNLTLYAKWTETPYTITPSVSPAGAGSVNTVTDAHLVTPSSDITATPTNAVWVFNHWTCGTNVGIAGGKGTGDNPVTVTASQNSTITANFKHRYNLLGSKYESDKEKASMATGGMPGWTYGSGADFTINSYTADGDNATVDLSYTCTLDAGTYIFEIHDRQKGESLGRKGDGGGVYALTDGSSVQLRGGTDKDQSIFFYPQHAGQYTFRITYMTKDGNYYYPTVTIERPHQVYFGTGYAGIDNLSSVTSGTTGGTLAVTTSAGSLSNEDWVTYGTDVTYTPSAATGYTFEGFYSSNEYSDRFTQDNPWVHYNVTGDDNVYAKFVETSTSVTLANDGNGHVTIGGNTETSTTCGVTTTRELTAVPNDGYMFSSWDKSGDDITLSSTSTNPTTLRGQGAGATSGQTATANFTYRWALKAESDNWGSSEFIIGNISTDDVSGDVIGYVEISLAANTNYQFTMKDLLTNDIYKNNNTEVQYMTYSNHTDWGFATDMTYNCGITTAGRGTYRFTWNITDTTMTVTYPTSYLVNLGVKSVTYEGVEGSLGTVTATDASSNTYSNGLYIANGETVTITATPADDYDFVGWWNSSDYSGNYFANANPTSWTVGAAVYAYAKFTEKSNTFSAASGSNWSTTANWSAGHVPTIHEVAVINKPVTVDIAHAVANRIVLDQNSHTGKLTVQANKGLEVAGTITRTTDGSNRLATREEDLVLESSSAGNASLIFNNSNSCAATVQMYSKATIVGNTWNWQYVGTPFTGSIPQYNYYGSWMYKWNGGWEVVHGGDELTPFAGYCLTQNSATTHVMGGTLVPTTSKSVTMAASTDMVLANSWTAPIWIGGFTASTFTSEPATIYLFNTGSAENGSNEYVSGDEAGTYVTVPVHAAEYTDNEFIAPMQGFFVTTNGVGGSSGTITMNYNDLVRPSGVHTGIVAGPMKVRKQEDMKPEVMKIRANGTQYSDRVVILAREDFSEGFDNGWDGEKLSFGAEAPSVYVINEQGGYDAVSAIPGFEGTLVGFRAGTNNSCTMTFEYDGEEIWYLNDLQTQQSTLIDSELTYTFSTSSYDNEARFIISATPIRKITTGNESVGAEAAKVRKLIINDKLYIIRGGRMYSADGAMIK